MQVQLLFHKDIMEANTDELTSFSVRRNAESMSILWGDQPGPCMKFEISSLIKTIVEFLIAFRKKSEYFKCFKLVRGIFQKDSSFFFSFSFWNYPSSVDVSQFMVSFLV